MTYISEAQRKTLGLNYDYAAAHNRLASLVGRQPLPQSGDYPGVRETTKTKRRGL